MCFTAVRHQILAAEEEGKPRPEVPPPEASNGHVLAVHRLHAADAEDAWMQREWGEIQVAQGNYQQAATHFEACSCCPVIMLLSEWNNCMRRQGCEIELPCTTQCCQA